MSRYLAGGDTFYRAVITSTYEDGRVVTGYAGPYLSAAGATQAIGRAKRRERNWYGEASGLTVSGTVEETTPEWVPKKCSACGH